MPDPGGGLYCATAGTPSRSSRLDTSRNDRILGEGPVFKGQVDAHQVLVDNAAGAKVHVADLGVAHLPLGQSYGATAGLELGFGIAACEAIVKWSSAKVDCRHRGV